MLMKVFISHFLLQHCCFNYQTNKDILYINGFSGAMFLWIISTKLYPKWLMEIVFFLNVSHSIAGLPCLHSS